MKVSTKNRLILGLSILTSTSLVHNPACGMETLVTVTKTGVSGLCSATELFITLAPAISSLLLHLHDLYPEKLKNIKSDAPENIINFVTEIAKERGVDNIKVCLDNCHDYCTNDNGGIIFIPYSRVPELESLITKANDSKKLNEHRASIHHELTHILLRSQKDVNRYQTILSTVGGIAISTALTRLLKKHIPMIDNNFMLSNACKVIRGLCTICLIFHLQSTNLYKKYDELRADDGIPNEKKLLEAVALKYEKRHADLIDMVKHVKNKYSLRFILCEPMSPEATLSRAQFIAMKLIPAACFDYPLLTELIFHSHTEHPSDLRRANRFKNRIAQLERDGSK